MRCHCHKKLAQVQTDGTLLLYCRNCRCDVSLDLKQQKVAALMSIAERIDTLAPRSPEESIQSLTQIASLIAAL